MEPWRLARYVRPYLAASVSIVDGDIVLEGETGAHIVRSAGVTPPRITAVLQRLRNPGDVLWEDLRAEASGARLWLGLVDALDKLALLGDAAACTAPTTDSMTIQRTVDEIMTVAAQRGDRFPAVLQGVARILAHDAHDLGSDEPDRGDFFLELLRLETMYWRRCAPRSLATASGVVARVAAELPAVGRLPALDTLETTTELYDADALPAHLELLSLVLRLAGTEEANRRLAAANTADDVVSGTSFALRAEHAVGGALRALGAPAFVVRLEDPVVSERLVRAYVVEDYHLTRRYVEAITPLLAKRTRETLRTLLFRYYAEEIGHERFALRTAVCCGLSEEAMRTARPGVLRTAFMDALSVLADREPISLLVCLLVTEGLPSVEQPIVDLVARVPQFSQCFSEIGREHADLNAVLHHETLPRLLLSQVPRIGLSDQKRAFERLAFMVELNHRAWESLCQSVMPGVEPTTLC